MIYKNIFVLYYMVAEMKVLVIETTVRVDKNIIKHHFLEVICTTFLWKMIVFKSTN